MKTSMTSVLTLAALAGTASAGWSTQFITDLESQLQSEAL